MPMKSHLDPCLFVVYMHVSGENLEDKLASIVSALQLRNGESFSPVLESLAPRTKQVLFHEEYHFWQGLRLPFLYRYASLAYRTAFLAFTQLSRNSANPNDWSCMLPELERLNLPDCIGTNHDGDYYWSSSPDSIPINAVDKINISPLDLLECAASIAEFQVTVSGDYVDPSNLKRWLKRNPAYLVPYSFAARALEDEYLALRTILPLINASFHTTQPSRTFVELLARIQRNFAQPDEASRKFLAQGEPRRWPEIFARWLDEIQYDGSDNSGMRILGETYHRLALDYWVYGELTHDGDFMIHPFLGPLARKWSDIAKMRPKFSWLLDLPGWVDSETFRECRSEFRAPLSIFRFHMGQGRDRVFSCGTGVGGGFTSIPGPTDGTYRDFIADTLTMYGAVRRASNAHFNELQRTCHHSECPHYIENFCNAYPIVPLRFEDCGFPARLTNLIAIQRKGNVDN